MSTKLYLLFCKWIVRIACRLITLQVESIPVVLVQIDPLSDTSREIRLTLGTRIRYFSVTVLSHHRHHLALTSTSVDYD